MSVNFEYYKIFYYVAKYKSITQAASLLYSSQPSISRMIKILEQELGCTLFIRTPEGRGSDSGRGRTFRPCGPCL